MPSQSLNEGPSGNFSVEFRRALADKVAALVDENITGRSDMCMQYAALMALALEHLDVKATAMVGQATYMGAKRFTWDHSWVETENGDIIDCNVDSVVENPAILNAWSVPAWWGAASSLPSDRKLQSRGSLTAQKLRDPDVEAVWWPDLRTWIDENANGVHVGIE